MVQAVFQSFYCRFQEQATQLKGFVVRPQVVEIADNEKTQADALSVLLSLQRRCDYHAKAMDQEAGYALIKRVLLTPRCQIGYHMLKVC